MQHVSGIDSRSLQFCKFHEIDGRVYVCKWNCEWIVEWAKECIKPWLRLQSTESIDGCRRWYRIILWWISTLYISSPPAEAILHKSKLKLNKLIAQAGDPTGRITISLSTSFYFPSSYQERLIGFEAYWHFQLLCLQSIIRHPPSCYFNYGYTYIHTATHSALLVSTELLLFWSYGHPSGRKNQLMLELQRLID